MKLNQWEVWQTRTTRFLAPPIDLADVAKRLVASGACNVALHSCGHVWYSEDASAKDGPVTLQHRPFDTRSKVTVPPIKDGYGLLCTMLGAEMLFSERLVFSEHCLRESAYVRCFFDPMYLEEDGVNTQFYPMAKIYSNGLCVFSLRVLSPDEPTPFDVFVQKDLNLGFRYFSKALVSARFIRACPINDLLNHLVQIDATMPDRIGIDGLVSNLVGEVVGVDEREDAPKYLRMNLEALTGYSTLELIWVMLEGLVDSVALRPRRLSLTAYRFSKGYEKDWFGHPITYIISWPGQPYRASDLDRVEPFVKRILGRSSTGEKAVPTMSIEKMPRLYDDYRSYVNESGSAYVLTRQKLERAEPEDEAYRRLVLPLQVKEEMGLWLVGSYRALEKQALSENDRAEVRSLQKEKNRLDAIRGKLARYGEVIDFMESYLVRFGAPGSSDRAGASLAIAETAHKDLTNLRLARIGVVLALMFGLIGSGQFADSVIGPLRSTCRWLPRISGVATKVSDFVLAAGILLVIFLFAWLIISRLDRGK